MALLVKRDRERKFDDIASCYIPKNLQNVDYSKLSFSLGSGSDDLSESNDTNKNSTHSDPAPKKVKKVSHCSLIDSNTYLHFVL